MKLLIYALMLVVLAVPAFAITDIVYDNVVHTVSADGRITTEFDVLNVGNTDFTGSFLAEVQYLGPNEVGFSVYTTEQKVCDPAFTDNVHKMIIGTLPAANPNSIHVSLTSPVMPPATYRVVGVSTDGCCSGTVDLPADGECTAMQPFYWKRDLGTVVVPDRGQAPAVCGDNICSGTESAANCPKDCGTCGDNVCSFTESSQTCFIDCPDKPQIGGEVLGGISKLSTSMLIIVVLLIVAGGGYLWVKRKH